MIIFTEMNKNIKYSDCDEKSIILLNKFRNFILYNYYYYEYKKFKVSYIRYYYYKNKLLSIIYCNYLDKLHREDGPAWIQYNNGEISVKEYYLNDVEYSYDNYILKIKKLD